MPHTYPLAIWTWRGIYAASWGHHHEADFLISLAEDHGVNVPTGTVVRRGYARIGFDGEGGRCVHAAKGPGRGVRPITEVELW